MTRRRSSPVTRPPVLLAGLASGVLLALAGCSSAPRERLVLPPLEPSRNEAPPSMGAKPVRSTNPWMRNLLVEVRSREVSAQEIRDIGLSGGGVVLTERGAQGRIDATVSDISQSLRTGSTQRVQVLNGGSASLFIGEARPWRWQSVAWTRQGPRVTQVQGWVETGRGFTVQPRWPGDGPVSVNLLAQDGRMAPGGTQAQTLSTVQAPLGDWMVVASVDDQAEQSTGRVLGRTDRAQARRWILEVRVTAP